MHDVAHVGLVDAHAEGDGRDDDDAGLGEKEVLVFEPVGLVHAGVIGQRADPLALQDRGGLFRLAPRQAIDDAGHACAGCDEVRHLLLPAPLHADGKADVGPVEAGDEDANIACKELRGKVGAGGLVGACGQRHRGHAREMIAKP